MYYEGAVMSQQKPKLHEELEQCQLDDDADDLDIDTTDYGFIVTADGRLKTFFCPDTIDGWPPKEVLKIFKVFKITNLTEVLPQSTTIH